MMGKDETPSSSGGSGGGSTAPPPFAGPAATRKMFWRSASWSASRSSIHHRPETEDDRDPNNTNEAVIGPNFNTLNNSNNSQGRRFPVPLTPRSSQNPKARSCLPPLQPLSIARRSLEEWPKASSDDIGEWPQPPTPSGRASYSSSGGGGGERLKLDLTTIQKNPPDLVRRDKIAFFDKECSKVAEHIYLGGDAVAKDKDILRRNGITHILNCVGFVCPEYFKSDFAYRTLWLQDSPSEDITSILYDVFDYFEDVRESRRGRVFVHCCQGVSRSTSLVIAYLMWREGQSFDDAFRYVKAARGIADPNMGFACQLLQCQKRVHAFPLSPSSLLRVYRMAPHSPYDPLHLVPKMLNDPSPTALDSRGAFIVHVPSAIHVWIGKNCEAIMERDARGAVGQIVRYEKVQGPVTLFKEGEEPAYFWDAFSNILPLMDKASNANGKDFSDSTSIRKVDSYDVDFEIFHKAIMGGIVPPFASPENEHETHLPARESSWSILRRKFASGNMKDFVSAPRGTLSRVYSESMMLVHFSSKNTSSSPSSSSSSSSPYLSPDSVCSEPSTSSKYSSESSLDSPFAVASGCVVSSPLSSLSNLSLSPKSKNPEAFASGPWLQKPPLSLAERRGSFSKSLKLPNKLKPTVSKEGHHHLDSSDADSIVYDFCNPKENNSGKGSFGNVERETPRQSKVFPSWDVSASDNQLKESESTSCIVHRLVCCSPGSEAMAKFGSKELDSKSAYAIFSPSNGFDKKEERVLYVWVGRLFDHNKSRVCLDNGQDIADIEELDWNKLGSDILIELGLPENSMVKIVKDGEEPAGFRSLLSLS